MKEILKAHPEVKTLFGNRASTVWVVLGVVALQIAVAWKLRDAHWGWMLAAAWTVGAVCNHAIFVLIHEATHNLILKGSTGNRWMGMIANLPAIFPAAMGFRTFHLLHHRHQGEFDRDADLSGPNEARWVGRSTLRKTLWMLGFWFVEGVIRPNRLKGVKYMDGWLAVNVLLQVAFTAAVWTLIGPMAVVYMFLSTMFAIGLHPLGARWIQEHYVIKPGQETYSYYGPFNKVMLNVGYHNEHHDLMMVPWMNLPKLKAMAPEFYDTLYSHRSYTGLLWRFLTDPEVTLFSRVTREGRAAARVARAKLGEAEFEPEVAGWAAPAGAMRGAVSATPATN